MTIDRLDRLKSTKQYLLELAHGLRNDQAPTLIYLIEMAAIEAGDLVAQETRRRRRSMADASVE